MGKIISIIAGTVAVMVGIILIFAWRDAFILGLEFTAIMLLIMGGIIAVVAGASEIKDQMAAKSQEKKQV